MASYPNPFQLLPPSIPNTLKSITLSHAEVLYSVLFWSANKNEVLFTKSPHGASWRQFTLNIGNWWYFFQDVWVWFFLFNQMISLTGTVICFILAEWIWSVYDFILITKTLPQYEAKYQILWICLNTADARVIREFSWEQEGSTSQMNETREIEGAILICAWTCDTCTLLYFILTSSSWILG